MAGRIAYFLIAGAAIVGGMALQGDINFNDEHSGDRIARAVTEDGDVAIDRKVDRAVDRRIDGRVDRRVDRKVDRETVTRDPATRHALSEAVGELVRAEGSLISLKLDDQIPPSVIKQAEQRRDFAKEAVERLADDARTGSRDERDAIRENLRDVIREAVRG